jgi:hypothetical protein
MKISIGIVDLEFGTATLRKNGEKFEHTLEIYYECPREEGGEPQSMIIYGNERLLKLRNLLNKIDCNRVMP